MSTFCRYFSRRRRRPTSSSRPRRLWWSCLWVFRCSVSSLMRLLSRAIWTSGDPVSPSPVAYSPMMDFLAAVSRDTALLRLTGTRECKWTDERPCVPTVAVVEGRHGQRTAPPLQSRHARLPPCAGCSRRSRDGTIRASARDPPGGLHVGPDLL